MTQPLALPVRFPRDLSPRPARKPLSFFERLVRVFMVTYNLTRAEALARVRSEYPFLTKEAAMNVTINDEEIEIPQEHSIGEHLHTLATRLVEKGVVSTYREGVALARERWPDLARSYDLGQVIQGPQVTYRPLRGEELLAQLKSDFNHAPGVPGATTLRAVVAAINAWVISEAVRTGKDPRMAWSQAVANDSNLREAAGMTPAAAGAVTEGGA